MTLAPSSWHRPVVKAAELRAGDELVVKVAEVFDTGHQRIQVTLEHNRIVLWFDADEEITASRVDEPELQTKEGWPEPAPLPADYWDTAE